MSDGFDTSLIEGAGLPPSDAIRFFRQKALLESERYGAVMNEAHARGFAVAGVTSQALLSDLKAAVNSALTDGTTLKEFQKTFDQIIKKHGWDVGGDPGWRAKIIYNTNLSTAYAAGQYAQLDTDEARDIYPCWRYRHHSCQHPRQDHVAWDGLVLANDDPWWDTHFPPNGWRCHCTIEPVTRSQMKRNNWTVSEAPPFDPRPWKNPATGKTEMVPKGIDPSFGYNPGKAWKEAERKAARTGPAPARRTHVGETPIHHIPDTERAVHQEKDIQTLLDAGRGEVTASEIPDNVRDLLGSDTQELTLSADSLSKNRAKHPDVTKDDYKALAQTARRPVAVLHVAKPHHVKLLLPQPGHTLSLIVKRTRDGSQNYVQSLVRVGQKELRRLARTARVLAGSVPSDLEKKR